MKPLGLPGSPDLPCSISRLRAASARIRRMVARKRVFVTRPPVSHSMQSEPATYAPSSPMVYGIGNIKEEGRLRMRNPPRLRVPMTVYNLGMVREEVQKGIGIVIEQLESSGLTVAHHKLGNRMLEYFGVTSEDANKKSDFVLSEEFLMDLPNMAEHLDHVSEYLQLLSNRFQNVSPNDFYSKSAPHSTSTSTGLFRWSSIGTQLMRVWI